MSCLVPAVPRKESRLDTDALPLAEAISSLRGELINAIEQAHDEDLQFSVETIELHMQVVATTSGGVSAGGGLWHVLTVNGKLDHTRATTHEVRMTLKPRTANGSDVLVGDDDVGWRPAHDGDAPTDGRG